MNYFYILIMQIFFVKRFNVKKIKRCVNSNEMHNVFFMLKKQDNIIINDNLIG
jgi:hypothetical protein